MQHDQPEDDAPVDAIEQALHPARLARYASNALCDRSFALRMYLWNLRLSEAYAVPLHFAEILIRNKLNAALIRRGGETWYRDPTIRGLLHPRFAQELDDAIRKETAGHGAGLTANHIVSALTFGFWEHLTTKRFHRYLWARGVRTVFPFAPPAATPADVQAKIESARRWRNRIAHHNAIFDKSPMRKYQDILSLISWCCPETARYVASITKVNAVLASRPKP